MHNLLSPDYFPNGLIVLQSADGDHYRDNIRKGIQYMKENMPKWEWNSIWLMHGVHINWANGGEEWKWKRAIFSQNLSCYVQNNCRSYGNDRRSSAEDQNRQRERSLQGDSYVSFFQLFVFFLK